MSQTTPPPDGTPRSDRCDAEWTKWLQDTWTGVKSFQTDTAPMTPIECARQLERELQAAREENQRFRNGFDNLLAGLEEAPGLPMELLSKDDLEKWTDTITGILLALGSYKVTGKPMGVWDALKQAALPAAPDAG